MNEKEKTMKMKLTMLGSAIAAILMISGMAMATPFPVQFDADGAGTGKIAETIWGWDLEAWAKETIPAPNANLGIYGTGTNNLVEILTHQQLGADGLLSENDTFYENITVNVINGLGSPNDSYPALRAGVTDLQGYYNDSPGAHLFIDIALAGHIENVVGTADATNPTAIALTTFTSIFDSGTATMYYDFNNDKTFNGGDTMVATFDLAGAGSFILTPSVFNGVGAQISYAFQTTAANPAYFSDAPGYPGFFDAIANGWHFTLTQGGVALVGGKIGGLTTPDPDEILLGFQETGFDAKFDAVPEPSTILLLGCGLVGVAAFGRKRLSK